MKPRTVFVALLAMLIFTVTIQTVSALWDGGNGWEGWPKRTCIYVNNTNVTKTNYPFGIFEGINGSVDAFGFNITGLVGKQLNNSDLRWLDNATNATPPVEIISNSTSSVNIIWIGNATAHTNKTFCMYFNNSNASPLTFVTDFRNVNETNVTRGETSLIFTGSTLKSIYFAGQQIGANNALGSTSVGFFDAVTFANGAANLSTTSGACNFSNTAINGSVCKMLNCTNGGAGQLFLMCGYTNITRVKFYDGGDGGSDHGIVGVSFGNGSNGDDGGVPHSWYADSNATASIAYSSGQSDFQPDLGGFIVGGLKNRGLNGYLYWNASLAAIYPLMNKTHLYTRQANSFGNDPLLDNLGRLSAYKMRLPETDMWLGVTSSNSTAQIEQDHYWINEKPLISQGIVEPAIDTTIPYFTLNKTNATNTVFKGGSLGINVTVNDETSLDTCTFSHNQTGTWVVSAKISVGGGTASECVFNVSITKKGQFYFNYSINDSSNNLNQSPIFTAMIANTAPMGNSSINTTTPNSRLTNLGVAINQSDHDSDVLTQIFQWFKQTGLIIGATLSNLSSGDFANLDVLTFQTTLSDGTNSTVFNSSNVTVISNLFMAHNGTDADNSTYNARRNWAFINVSITNYTSVHTVILNWNGTNETYFRLNVSDLNGFAINKTGLLNGNYTYFMWLNDSASNENGTERRTTTIDLINPNINFTAITDGNNTLKTTNYTFVNVSFTDSHNHTFIINWNGTNYTQTSINSTLTYFYHNFTRLLDGNYTYYAWINDTAGNSNQTETRQITIETTKPAISGEKNVSSSTALPTIYVSDDAILNATITDTFLSGVNLSTNTTGIWANYTVTSVSGNVYTFTMNKNNYTLTNITASVIYWRYYAVDQAGNIGEGTLQRFQATPIGAGGTSGGGSGFVQSDKISCRPTEKLINLNNETVCVECRGEIIIKDGKIYCSQPSPVQNETVGNKPFFTLKIGGRNLEFTPVRALFAGLIVLTALFMLGGKAGEILQSQ